MRRQAQRHHAFKVGNRLVNLDHGLQVFAEVHGEALSVPAVPQRAELWKHRIRTGEAPTASGPAS